MTYFEEDLSLHLPKSLMNSFTPAPSDLFYTVQRGPFLIHHLIAVFAHAVCADNNKKLMKKRTDCNELVILLNLYLELILIVVGGR